MIEQREPLLRCGTNLGTVDLHNLSSDQLIQAVIVG